MFETLLVLPVLLAIGIFLWLWSREKKRAETGQPRLATWRLALASVFALVALFSGGCSLLFIPDAMRGTQYVDFGAVLVIGGVPFGLAALFLWLSLKRSKTPGEDKTS